ncbi:MAG: DUF547 domain-containing protein [Bacteroidota bacterium]
MAYLELLRNCRLSSSAVMIICLALGLCGCSAIDPQKAETSPVSHEIFDELLARHVDKQGYLDYEGVMTDRAKLRRYLTLITQNPPNDQQWSSSEKLAYWINLYNAFTIELVLDYYPVASIKDIGSSIQVPFVNTPWDIKMIEIDGKKYDLNNVEHNILRKIFDEPRIHFAINCASASCPKLRREAYRADIIDRQLHEQTIDFINDPERNDITTRPAQISKLFQWWKGDFTRDGTVREYINQYAAEPLEEGADIDYLEYDWSINKAGS